MAVSLIAKILPSVSTNKLTRPTNEGKLSIFPRWTFDAFSHPLSHSMIAGSNPRSGETAPIFVEAPITSGRRALLFSGAFLVAVQGLKSGLEPLMIARAAEESTNSKASDKTDDNNGILSSITSLLDPNEKTKSGKVLPKAYLKSAREVVKTLRESLNEDSKSNAKFRRTADAAKESIREYLGSWSGQQAVAKEESYVELEKAIRALAGFYSKAGPTAALPEGVRAEILDELNVAEQFL